MAKIREEHPEYVQTELEFYAARDEAARKKSTDVGCPSTARKKSTDVAGSSTAVKVDSSYSFSFDWSSSSSFDWTSSDDE